MLSPKAHARTWLWALPCLVLLVGGAAWRWPTLHQANYLQFASQHLSYSDVIAFRGGEIASDHRLPYLERNLEYPVLTGAMLWLTGFAPGAEGYFIVNAVLLCSCLFGCFLLMARLMPDVRIARFAMAPGLALYGVQNWDAPPMAAMAAALYCLRGRHWGSAGGFLALGTSAKLFPAFAFPAILAYSLRDKPPGAGDRLLGLPVATVRYLVGFGVVLLILNLPLALLTWHGWSYWIVNQAQRGTNLDAIWTHIPNLSQRQIHGLMASLMVGALAWITFEVWHGGRGEAGVLLSLLAFLLVTRDYSPQYDLWILPMLALLCCPIWIWLVYVAADAFYDFAIFHFYATYASNQSVDTDRHATALVGWSVWGRELALVLVAVWGWRCIRHRE